MATDPTPRRPDAGRPFPVRRAAAALAALGALLLAGCANPGTLPPRPELLDEARLLGGPGASPTPWPGIDWYRAFDDAGLDALIDLALAGTPTLQAAIARADKAASAAGATRASLWPQLGLDASTNRQRLSGNGLYPPPYAGATLSMNNIQLTGAWELDLFGEHRAELDAAVGAARAAEIDAQAARILLTTQIARGWFGLARLLEQQRTLTEIQGQRRQTVTLVQQRVTAGLDTMVELRQAQSQAFEVDRELASLAEQIVNTRHGLAALAGQGPRALDAAAPRWSETKTLAWPTEIPADLLGRRADLTAARVRVESALRGVDAARATFYPNISLTAFVGLNAIGFPDWLNASSRTFGIGPALHLPIFEAGRLRANLRGRNADVDGAIAAYNGTLVDAVRDVADRIESLESLRDQRARQVDVQRTTDEASQLATARYRAGLGTFLTVLQAQTGELTQSRVTTDLKYRVIDTQIALIQALGGGFQADSVPLPQTAAR